MKLPTSEQVEEEPPRETLSSRVIARLAAQRGALHPDGGSASIHMHDELWHRLERAGAT